MLLAASYGCASSTASLISAPSPAVLPQAYGAYYRVQPGETLWRIARDFGWDAHALAQVNRIGNPQQVTSGQMLFIPAPPQTNHFLWPARGGVAPVKVGNATASLEITAPEGSFVRAARTGRVAVAARELQGFGKTVLLDHGDGYVSVYAGLEQVLVAPGASIRQGNPIGRLGRAPLYFQIRSGARVQDPLRLLP